MLVDDHELQRYISSWSNSFGCIWDVWIGYICLCCLLWDDWMDLKISNQIWVNLNRYDDEMTFSMSYGWIYMLWEYSNKLATSLIHICWSISQLLKSVIYWKSEWAEKLATFRWSNLFGLAWNLVCMIYTYSMMAVQNFMRNR